MSWTGGARVRWIRSCVGAHCALFLACATLPTAAAAGPCDPYKGRQGDRELLTAAVEFRDQVCIGFLLARNPRLVPQNDGGWTALHVAASGGDPDLVRFFLDRGERATARAWGNDTPLMALAGGYLSCVSSEGISSCNGPSPPCDCAAQSARRTKAAQLLIERGGCQAEPVATDKTSLAKAIERGNEDVIGVLLAHASQGCASALDDAGLAELAFRQATWGDSEQARHLRGAERLIAGGARVVVPVARGNTLLHRLADWDQPVKEPHEPLLRNLVAALLRRGVDVNCADADGRTPLHVAAARGAFAIMRVLLDAGADPNRTDENKRPALFDASAHPVRSAVDRSRDLRVVTILLDRGARADALDKLGGSTAEAAMQAGWAQAAQLLHSRGARLDATVALHKAVWSGDSASVRLAIEMGAPADGLGASQRLRPICIAAERCAAPAVALLLDRGASIATDCGGTSVLHIAAQRGEQATVALLLSRGANPDAANTRGETPLSLALLHRHRDTVRTLRSHGASRGDSIIVYVTPNAYLGVEIPLQSRKGGIVYALRPELLFKRPYGGLGAGVYGEALTRNFEDSTLGGGVLLAPSSPVVPSAGGYGRKSSDQGWHAGLTAGALVGFHTSNRAAPGEKAGPGAGNAGLRIDLRWGLGDARDRAVTLGLEVDLDYLWLFPMALLTPTRW